jgi:metal-responsive CopG/Arc/MetJ family transcriptional regulator
VGVLSRIGIALDSELLKRFDRLIGRRGYTDRSETFRKLIRNPSSDGCSGAHTAGHIHNSRYSYDSKGAPPHCHSHRRPR